MDDFFLTRLSSIVPVMARRCATVQRETNETRIDVTLDLDGQGHGEIDTGLPFLDHMLDQIARHSLVDLKIHARGDLSIDAHHTVEDVGICVGKALLEALHDKQGIRRYGHAYVPLDEALSRVVLDCSGRPGLQYQVRFFTERAGELEVELFQEFFQALVNHAFITLHIDCLRGSNTHHIIETVFKAFGRALREATEHDPQMAGVMPSTKGSL